MTAEVWCDRRGLGSLDRRSLACEIGFWVVLAAGLLVRYVLRRRRLGGWLLAGVPLVDLALLVFTVLDLRRGTPVQEAHALAAL